MFPRKRATREIETQVYIDAWVDGGCKGNPGPVTYAIVLDIEKNGLYHGSICNASAMPQGGTSNQAEYLAFIHGLRAIRDVLEDYPDQEVRVNLYTDSQLVYEQLKGDWAVKSENLEGLHEWANQELVYFTNSDIHHLRIFKAARHEVRQADKLGNLAGDRIPGNWEELRDQYEEALEEAVHIKRVEEDAADDIVDEILHEEHPEFFDVTDDQAIDTEDARVAKEEEE